MKTVPPYLFDHLETLIKLAKASGADAVDGMAVESTGQSVAIRQGKLTDIERSETYEIGLRAFVGKKNATLATNNRDTKEFPKLAEQLVAMAKLAPEDPYAGLADATDFATTIPDLDLYDAQERDAQQLIESAKRLDAGARSYEQITNVEESSASAQSGAFAFVTSNGFAHGYKTSGHGLSVSTIAGKDTSMVRDYDFSSVIHASDLRTPEDIAHVAATRTISRLNARKMGTAQIPVVFSSRVARGLVSAFLSAISGNAIARKSSFLQNALNTQIFASSITIEDDPFIPRGLRSKPFDGEGLSPQKRMLVDKGRLTTWLMNCSAARQLNLKSTGHASRGVSGSPGISAHNIALLPGILSPEQLIGDIEQGFFVTETMGFGVNTLTGDFSQGAAGFWIEKGQLVFPVHEMTIAGNLTAMFKAMTPANDLTRRYGVDSPTLRIEGMMVAGS